MGKYKDLVSWDEVNACWGLAALLLCSIARRKKFTFTMYRIIPMGNFSLVEHIHSGIKHQLYFSTARNLNSFNNAMLGFLYCLHEICEYVRKKQSKSNLTDNEPFYQYVHFQICIITILGLKMIKLVVTAYYTYTIQILIISCIGQKL